MKIFIVGHDKKCGECNWNEDTLFALANSQQEADEMFKAQTTGFCGRCMSESLVNSDANIRIPKAKKTGGDNND
ncbi:MAG: hypothetical protein WC976_06025 [Caldisericia bacterium]